MWVFSAILSLVGLLVPVQKGRYAVLATVEVFCLIITASLYYNIYLAVQHHANQIHVLQVQQEAQNREMANTARLRKSAIGTFYVYLVFLVCYLPQNCLYFASIISGSSTTTKVLVPYVLTLVFLNLWLNPPIYYPASRGPSIFL